MKTRNQILTKIENEWKTMTSNVMSSDNSERLAALLANSKTDLLHNIQVLIDLAFEEGQNNVYEAMNS